MPEMLIKLENEYRKQGYRFGSPHPEDAEDVAAKPCPFCQHLGGRYLEALVLRDEQGDVVDRVFIAGCRMCAQGELV